MVHPTLVVAFPGLAQSLVGEVEPLWRTRLGKKILALEVTHPEALVSSLQALLDQSRLLELKRAGLDLDPALTLVVLAPADPDQLFPHLKGAEAVLKEDPWAGMEVRIHLVLFVRGPESLQALEALPPDPGHPIPTRVWPLSLWSRNGLRLPKEEHLKTCIQHFVEALVLTQAPLQPSKGRDWMGLGIARLELEQPDPAILVPKIWEAIQGVRLGPSPRVPTPSAEALRAALAPHASQPPPLPERKSCEAHPPWLGEAWQARREKLRDAAAEAVESLLLPLEAQTPFDLGRKALLGGVPNLVATLEELDKALSKTSARKNEVLEILNQTAGTADKWARLRRLKARRERRGLTGASLEGEIQKLESELEEVRKALEDGDTQFFLERDPKAKEATQRLRSLEEEFKENHGRWNENLPHKEPPLPWWRRLFWRKPLSLSEETVHLRKRLCDKAWHLLQEAQEAEQELTERQVHFLLLLKELSLVQEHLEALKRERNRAQQALSQLESFTPPSASPEENPLVLRVSQELPSDHPQLRAAALELVQEGVLEAFWDGDVSEVKETLRETAERLAERLGPRPLREIPEELWSTLVAAAAPRVLVRNWPEHHQFAYVLGPTSGRRWGESYEAEPWFPGESVLMRMVYPLYSEHLLADFAPSLHEARTSEGPPPTSPLPPPGPGSEPGIRRDNPLLDELLA
jgi:hypothetical protein